MFNGLVKYHTDLSVIGDLAESWDISKDGLVITFHLRKGVKWADGAAFTADDVKFGYDTIVNEKTPTAYKEDFLQVKKQRFLINTHSGSHMKNHLRLHSRHGAALLFFLSTCLKEKI